MLLLSCVALALYGAPAPGLENGGQDDVTSTSTTWPERTQLRPTIYPDTYGGNSEVENGDKDDVTTTSNSVTEKYLWDDNSNKEVKEAEDRVDRPKPVKMVVDSVDIEPAAENDKLVVDSVDIEPAVPPNNKNGADDLIWAPTGVSERFYVRPSEDIRAWLDIIAHIGSSSGDVIEIRVTDGTLIPEGNYFQTFKQQRGDAAEATYPLANLDTKSQTVNRRGLLTLWAEWNNSKKLDDIEKAMNAAPPN